MYAVIQTGGHQYRVETGSEFTIEKIAAAEGESITFDNVLLVRNDDGIQVGAPFLEGASVSGTVLGQERARKILVFKFKKRKNYKRLRGHRQHQTRIRIDKIQTA